MHKPTGDFSWRLLIINIQLTMPAASRWNSDGGSKAYISFQCREMSVWEPPAERCSGHARINILTTEARDLANHCVYLKNCKLFHEASFFGLASAPEDKPMEPFWSTRALNIEIAWDRKRKALPQNHRFPLRFHISVLLTSLVGCEDILNLGRSLNAVVEIQIVFQSSELSTEVIARTRRRN